MLPEKIERKLVNALCKELPVQLVLFYPGKIHVDVGYSTIKFEDERPAKLVWKVLRFLQLRREGELK